MYTLRDISMQVLDNSITKTDFMNINPLPQILLFVFHISQIHTPLLRRKRSVGIEQPMVFLDLLQLNSCFICALIRPVMLLHQIIKTKAGACRRDTCCNNIYYTVNHTKALKI